MSKVIKNILIIIAAASFPILFIFAHNPGYLEFSDVFVILVVIILFFILMWFVSWFVLKDQERAIVATVFFIFYFFSYKPLMMEIAFLPANVIHNIIFISFSVFSFIYIIVVLLKTSVLEKIKVIISVMVVCLLILNILMIFKQRFLKLNIPDENLTTNLPLNISQCRSVVEKPDIYYIILDAHAREDVLARYYSTDNSDFINFLVDNNYYVADESYANYPTTFLALSSYLNMSYHQDFNSKRGDNSILIDQLLHNKVMDFLDECGYISYSFATGFHGTEMKKSDYYLSSPHILNDFHQAIIEITPFNHVPLRALFYYLFDSQKQRVLFTLNNLPKLAEIELSEPKFVMAHITSPHGPFVFNEDGPIDNEYIFQSFFQNIYNSDDARKKDFIKLYSDQLLYIDKAVKQTLIELKEKIKRPSIIIVQSDHGVIESYILKTSNLNAPEYLYRRFAILNAYYFYDGQYSNLYESISPVNSFRVIFSQYLAQELPLLEDRMIDAFDLSGYTEINKQDIEKAVLQ